MPEVGPPCNRKEKYPTVSFLSGSTLAWIALLGGCLVLAWWIIRPFVDALLWALILAYITWPLYASLRSLLHRRNILAASLLTGGLALTATLFLGWIGWQLQVEVADFLSAQQSHNGTDLQAALSRIPWLGEWLQNKQLQWSREPFDLRDQLWHLFRQYSSQLLHMLGSVGKHTLIYLFTFLSLFFIYRDGDRLLEQTRMTVCGLLGGRALAYLHAIGLTLKAVIYGLVLTALGQGLMAAIGFWLVGLEAPVLLGLLTALVALVPFGAPLVWGAASLWVILVGKFWLGIGLFAWGLLVMAVVDNFIRPLVISQASRIHFLIVLYGVLGGIELFGLLGLFIGPVILSVLLAIWREWVREVDRPGPP